MKISKKILIGAVLIAVTWGSVNFADKYFNKATAEANLIAHTTELFGKAPDKVSCPQVDSGNFDNRLTCEARYGDNVKIYLCRGLFDALDSSCISPKVAALSNNG